jgi:hypothetical protein
MQDSDDFNSLAFKGSVKNNVSPCLQSKNIFTHFSIIFSPETFRSAIS